MVVAEYDLIPAETHIRMAVGDDKQLTAGPFYRGTVLIPRTGLRLRFVVKATKETPDAQAVIDWNSVTNPTLIAPVGAVGTGQWLIDLSETHTLLTPGWWYGRVDIADTTSNTVKDEMAGKVIFNVESK